MNVLLWGAGSIGGEVGSRLARAGHRVTAVTATPRRHPDLAAAGMQPALAGEALDFASFDATLIATAGSESQAVAARSLVGRVGGRVVFTSTTAVHLGVAGLVSFDGPRSDAPRARAAWEAEQAASALDAVIVRLGGLYRAGRGPAAAFERARVAPPGEGGRSLALIHEHDAATALVAALVQPSPRPGYLAVTPPCPTRADFYAALAARLGMEPPALDPGGQPTFYDVTDLRRDLLPAPAYPDWRAAIPG